jgi:ABC-type uncharacterized transport system ATPase component
MMVTHNLRYAVEYGSRLIMMNEGRVFMKSRRREGLLDRRRRFAHLYRNQSSSAGTKD